MTSTHDIKYILRSMYDLRDELVPCFIGAPGIGKTVSIKQFAEEKGAKLVTFILSTALPSEVSGIRMPDTDTKSLEVFDDARMASLEDGDILFFDEILEAPPALWSACLTLIQDRQLASGRKLPNVMIVAASNPVNNPAMIPASLRDRFQFFEVNWDFNSWKEILRKEWQDECSQTAKLNSIKSYIHSCMGQERYGYNVMTPRRFHKLMKWYDAAHSRQEVYAYINQMFGANCADLIKDFFNIDRKEKEKREQMAQAINAVSTMIGVELESDISMAELFEIINELPEEDNHKVVEFLKGIEVERD